MDGGDQVSRCAYGSSAVSGGLGHADGGAGGAVAAQDACAGS
ncbi:hypothetical protein [Streptomyces griseorubiginosus]